MINVVIAILILSVVIIAHEFGHFIIAKANGVCVVEFSIGFGPRLFSFRIGDTDYCIKALPFGGSCRMLGEADQLADPASEDHDPDTEENVSEVEKRAAAMLEKYGHTRTLEAKSVSARIAILAAGTVFNFIFALVMSIFMIGLNGYDAPVVKVADNSPVYNEGLRSGDRIISINGRHVNFAREISFYRMYHESDGLDLVYERNGQRYTGYALPEEKTENSYKIGVKFSSDLRVGEVVKDSPAQRAGLRSNDKIISVDGTAIKDGEALLAGIKEAGGKEISILAERSGRIREVKLTPQIMETKTYYTGIAGYGERERTSPIKTIYYAFCDTGYRISMVIELLGRMFSGRLGVDNLSGPVGTVSAISTVVSEAKSGGALILILNILNISIMLSANLGVMNLLPIPALDGGKLILYIIEAVRGRPAGKKVEGVINFIGVVFIMLLTFFVLVKDIINLF
ncbi:MAG: RIP metalloprotease RseP [Clostridiales bacterium]|nr:RIP metalloprotease RseP [Clostridiales bacterium]